MPDMREVTIFCFGASYVVAFLFELIYQLRPRPIFRLIGLGFGIAGLLAHTLFLFVQPLLLSSPSGSLVFVGWIVAMFYLYGSMQRKVTWGLFVLPVVVGITVLAAISQQPQLGSSYRSLFDLSQWDTDRFWGLVHGLLILFASVGICVAFVASVMYLVQLQRVKAKVSPRKGMQMLSLERLDTMNRRAVTWSFPLLTIGLLLAVISSLQGQESFVSWDNLKLLSIGGLWVFCAILLYLRYARNIGGRQAALWTIFAFALLLFSLSSYIHPNVSGVIP